MADRPEWLKVRVPTPRESSGIRAVRDVLSRRQLHSICESARCPNVVECWAARTATFLLLGDVCTRSCRFCAVEAARAGRPLDGGEPQRLASAVRELGLHHVVLTSVDRDDLPDGGAAAFVAAVAAIREVCPSVGIEALTPDFAGRVESLTQIVASSVDVLAHNLETVRRLTPALRDRRATYGQSLRVLEFFVAGAAGRSVKSGLMVGLGERRDEVGEALHDMRDVGVDTVTVGQYLAPSPKAAPVVRFVEPEEFADIEAEARSIGFSRVLCGPRVRSSYRASELLLPSCASSSS